ncbi:MAG: tetratricopeptide repeat protein [Acidobacteriaceae bacterium]|nr:tetratricopeptide repeat protein [Acidobacteriaceae bacterium]
MNIRTLALSLAVLSATALPALAADKEQRQMMADLRILQEQSQQMQNLLASLGEALKAVNQRLDDQADADKRALADEKLAIDNLANDLRVLREKVDDTGVRVGSVGQELDALRQSVTALTTMRVTPVEPDAPDSAPAVATTAPVSPVGGSAAAVGASPQKLLDGAMADYYGGQYDLAVLGLESYIKTFPQSTQADFAQYHIGMSLFNDAKYDRAVDAFGSVITTYPRSSLLPDSYVKMGVAYKNLKQNAKAKEAFDYVIKNYPDSTAATIGRQQLEGLGRP